MRFSIEISREAHSPTRLHTDTIRIRPITTISDFKIVVFFNNMNDASDKHIGHVFMLSII